MLDFHNHLIPNVDDGAADIAESRLGLAAMAAQGVSAIITTPHFPASLCSRPAEFERAIAHMDEAWASLVKLAAEEFPGIRLDRGVEIMLDVPSSNLSDSRMRLAGTSFVLIEFPHMSIPPGSAQALRELGAAGWKPIVAHPERYRNMSRNFDLLDSWKGSGCFLQVNAGSIVGQYGSRAKDIAWEMLGQGMVDYVCSDYHSRGRLSLASAAAAFADAGGSDVWNALVTINAERILDDLPPLTVQPLSPAQPTLWERLTKKK